MEGDTAENDVNDTTVPISIVSNPLQDLLYRRNHYEKNCRHIAARRDSLYKAIPINHLVPLAFHTTPTLLESFQDINAVVKAVSEEYTSDLFSDWQRYCKALDFQQRAVATFEGSIFFAAESIPRSKERETWISSCLNHLHSLTRLISINEGDGSGRKRKRKRAASQDKRCDGSSIAEAPTAGPRDPEQIEATEMNVAIVAQVDKLETTLGEYLFKGVDATYMRRREKNGRMIKFTYTVHLHLAYREGEDFKLEVWVCSSTGKAISQAKMGSVEDLRSILGDYLFEAMDTSNWREEEKRKGMLECTGAVVVSFPNGDDSSDCKVEVMLNFGTGTGVYENIYPRVS